MTTNYYLSLKYFDWLCDIVGSRDRYEDLLTELHRIPFFFTINLDSNRADDGINLRYRFGADQGIDHETIMETLDVGECSVFEMMVALAIKCEEFIMDDPDLGNRTSIWFWNMIKSLGLTDMYDENFDDYRVRDVIHTFLSRRYSYKGHGGLFTVDSPPTDLRTVEIWSQMMWYLKSIMRKGC